MLDKEMIINVIQVAITSNCIKISNFAKENHQIYALNITYSYKIATFGLPTSS